MRQPLTTLLKNPPFWLAAVIALLPLAVLLILRDHASPHSSDDVAVQVAVDGWLRGHHHTTFLPSDNYLFKLPVYGLAELLPLAPHARLMLQVLALNLGCFALFILALIWLAKPKPSGRWNHPALIIPAIWLTLIGGAFGLDMLVANYRNLELGVASIIVALVHRYVTDRGHWSVQRSMLAGLLLSLFWFSDPYFPLLLCLPLIVFLAGWYLARDRQPRFIKVAGLLAGSAIASLAWRPAVAWLGIQVGGSASVSLADVAHNLALLWPSLASLLGIHFSHSLARGVESALTLIVLFVGLAASAANTWTGWRHRQFIWCFAGLQWVVIVTGFALSSYVYDIGAGRYLVLIPFYLVLNLVIWLNRSKIAFWRITALGLLLLASVVSLASDLHELTNPQLYPGITTQNQVLAALRATGLSKGYAQYWSANINTYLNDGQPVVVPIDCTAGHIKPLYWFTDTAALQLPAQSTFYLYEDNAPQATVCPLPALQADFGPPQRAISVDSHSRLLIYNYDISKQFVEVHPGQ